MTENQINRLYNLLSPNAVIDLRFCYGAQGEFGETVVQNLANKLRCKIRAYANQVSPIRTRPLYVINDKVPWMEKIFYYDRKEKTFYPK